MSDLKFEANLYHVFFLFLPIWFHLRVFFFQGNFYDNENKSPKDLLNPHDIKYMEMYCKHF